MTDGALTPQITEEPYMDDVATHHSLWTYPLLTQTNGYFCSRANLKEILPKTAPRPIISYLAQFVNITGASRRFK
ncbi:MAG: hypothetical protein JWM55_660 [Acidimicrobiaceae bacterium]|nr:hypothetical protein [Acidimicrobiaceae bacterium]